MTRGSRSKSAIAKIEREEEGCIQRDTENINGVSCSTVVSEQCTEPVDSMQSTKRPMTVLSEDILQISPPTKRRLISHTIPTSLKRPHVVLETNVDDENYAKIKKLDNKSPQKAMKGTWTSVINRSNGESAHSNKLDNSGDFVVASYNLSLLKDDSQHRLLMDELTFINADILCLQNFSISYWDILRNSLKDRGYHGDTIVDDAGNVLATLYRTIRFMKVSVDSDKLSKICLEHINPNSGFDEKTILSIKCYIEEPETYILTVLKDTRHDRLLIVGNTRLSKDNTKKSDLKCVQAVGIFWRIHDIICQLKTDHANNNHSSHTQQITSPCWILCGDFNGTIDSPVYQICHDGYPNESSIKTLQSIKRVVIGDDENFKSLVDLIWHSFQHPFTDSCNSYFSCDSSSSDYIWMSDKALYTNRVLLPSVTGTCGQTITGDAGNGSGFSNTFNNDKLFLACEVTFVT